MITVHIKRQQLQEKPLMVLIEGWVLGSQRNPEKALAFAEILRELHKEYPDTKFQFIPLTYERWNGEEFALTSILAIKT